MMSAILMSAMLSSQSSNRYMGSSQFRSIKTALITLFLTLLMCFPFSAFAQQAACEPTLVQTPTGNAGSGLVDCIFKNGFEACVPDITGYPDVDGDGFGDSTAEPLLFCDLLPPGFVNNALDCDDNNDAKFPGNIEICDGLDNNCDGVIDEGCSIANLPPDPVTVAPALDQTVTPPFGASTAFLYDQADPIQTGVDPADIDPVRAAVLRGQVFDITGAVLPGVTISVLHHPEFGQTLTRADGVFDMAVNGGAVLTVDYTRDGYLPAQRQVTVPWRDFAILDDIVMIQLDPAVVEIDLSQGIQTARGSIVVDDDGTRQSTLIFPTGTTAEAVLSDGTRVSLPRLNVRSTEYTVGPKGPEAMPAILPDTVAYTYAVEYSIDEALALGASSVEFNQPIPFYMENFIGFPAGIAVPTGYYDREKGAWIAAPDGVVVEIISIDSGTAEVDTTGDGFADNGTGLTLEERQQLGSLYVAGETLWRVLIPHFSPWDHNYPYGAPANATPPNQPEPKTDKKVHEPAVNRGHGVIEVDNQILIESIDIPGSHMTLNYNSSRVAGRTSTAEAIIQLTGSAPPSSLHEVRLQTRIAGRVENHVFSSPGPNLTHTVVWDGVDVYGREFPGVIKGRATIRYVYRPVYQARSSRQGGPTFGSIGGPSLEAQGRSFLISPQEVEFEVGLKGETAINVQRLGGWTLDAVHSYDSHSSTLFLGNGAQRSAGGQSGTISTLVGYPAQDSCCFEEPGSVCLIEDEFGSCLEFNTVGCQANFIDPGVCEYAQDDLDWCLSENAGDASLCVDEQQELDNCIADLTAPWAIEDARDMALDYCKADNGESYLSENASSASRIAPDGTIYFIQRDGLGKNSLYKRKPNGTLEIVIANISLANNLDISPDGSAIYVTALNGNTGLGNVVWKIDPVTKTKSIFAGQQGSPVNAISGDGGLAVNAQIYSPRSVEVARDGSVYVSLTHCIKKISSNGLIDTFAGNCNEYGFYGDGGGARDALFWLVSGLAEGPDGSIYVADHGNHRIRKIDTSGQISTYAGSGPIGMTWPGTYNPNPYPNVENDGQGFIPEPIYAGGDTGPASSAVIPFPSAIDFDIKGNLYIVGGRSWSGAFVYGNMGDEGRIVTPQGFIETFVANDPDGEANVEDNPFLGDGGPASKATIGTANQSVFTDLIGNIYINDQNERVRKISPAFPQFSGGDIGIASEDGGFLYRFDPSGRHVQTINSFTNEPIIDIEYDANGYLSKLTDAYNNVTTIQRDGSGRATAIVDPYGRITTLSVDTNGYLSMLENPAAETILLDHDANGLLVKVTDPKANEFTFMYDSKGRIQRATDPAGGFISYSRTEFPTGHEVTTTTSLGRISKVKLLNSTDGGYTRTTTRPDGTVHSYVKDGSGLETSTAPDGTIDTLVRKGDPRFGTQVRASQDHETITPAGLKLAVNYERTAVRGENDDVIRIIDEEGVNAGYGSNRKPAVLEFDVLAGRFDSVSSVGRSMNMQIDSLGRVTSRKATDAFYPVDYEFDSRGRLLKVSQGVTADLREAQYSHSPTSDYAESVIDANGEEVAFEYDGAGRITKRTLVSSGKSVSYGYDGNGNQTSVTPSGRSAYTFAFTALNQLESFSPPDIGIGNVTTQYDYNSDRQIDLITRPDGKTIDYIYQPNGQLTSVVSPTGTTTSNFDPVTGLISSTVSESGITTTYDYDGRYIVGVAQSGAVAGSVETVFNDDILTEYQTVNGGSSIRYLYDHDFLQTKAGDLTINRVFSNGFIGSTALDTINDDWAFNSFGELQQYTVENGSTIYDVQYTYDDNANVASKTETIGGVTDTYVYAYDAQSRLSTVTKNNFEIASYAFDANENRSAVTDEFGTVTGTYDGQDRVLTYGGNTYTHTNYGELLSKQSGAGTTTYDYDVHGNLLKVVLPDTTEIEYLYDAHDRRAGRKVNGTLVQGLLYKDALNPVAELDGSNALVSRFVYGTKKNVPDYMIKEGVKYRFVTDLQSSVRLLVNASTGAIAQRIDYDAYGRVLSDSNPGFQPFGYAGGLYDSQTQLVKFGRRDYDAETGRWTVRDPLLFRGNDHNLYGYVQRNPMTLTDPNGLGPQSEHDFWKGVQERARNGDERAQRALKAYLPSVMNINNDKAENPLASADVTFSLAGGAGWAGALNLTYSPGGTSLYVGGGMGIGVSSSVSVGATHTFSGKASSGPTVSLDYGGQLGVAGFGGNLTMGTEGTTGRFSGTAGAGASVSGTMGWTFTF